MSKHTKVKLTKKKALSNVGKDCFIRGRFIVMIDKYNCQIMIGGMAFRVAAEDIFFAKSKKTIVRVDIELEENL